MVFQRPTANQRLRIFTILDKDLHVLLHVLVTKASGDEANRDLDMYGGHVQHVCGNKVYRASYEGGPCDIVQKHASGRAIVQRPTTEEGRGRACLAETLQGTVSSPIRASLLRPLLTLSVQGGKTRSGRSRRGHVETADSEASVDECCSNFFVSHLFFSC